MNCTSALALLLPLFAAGLLAGGEALPRFTVRDGLPNVAAKLTAGKPVTVAFLGGSITKAGGEAGFSAAVPRWLQQRFPSATVTAVNAGINGTDSDFGAARVDRDIIARKPDLVFVEFVVNDGTSDRSVAMERIVRKLWTADPACGLVFIYTVSEDALPVWKAGTLPKAALAHERVATFYGIPTVPLGVDLLPALAAGTTWKSLMRDGCHPTDAGYAIYVQQISDALTAAFAAGKPGRTLPEKTLKPGLVLYPPAVAVEAMTPATPLVASDGRTAATTWELPEAGRQWRQDAEFRVDGKALWALYYQPWKIGKDRLGGKLDASFGLSRTAWQPMRWLEERSSFDGNEGMPLRYRTSLAARENDLPVITFVAPETGSYAFSIEASSAKVWSHHKRLALNLVHFPWGKDTGASVACAVAKDKTLPALTGTVELVAGEVLAACLDTDVNYGGGGALLNDLAFRVGLLPAKP